MPTMATKDFSLSSKHVLFPSFKTAPSGAHARRRRAPSPALLKHRRVLREDAHCYALVLLNKMYHGKESAVEGKGSCCMAVMGPGEQALEC